MTKETIKYKDGTEHEMLIVNPKEDNCPICDKPLKGVGFSWQIFHGEAKASCCGAIYQIKSYFVDEKKWGKEVKDFAESLDNPERIQCKIDGKFLEAYRQAFKELGIREISNKDVQERVKKLLNK